VVIGCRDPFAQVDGKGIEKLVAAGVKTEVGVLEQACQELNKRFFTFQTKHRPHVILKWAQTADGKMAGSPGKRLFITNAFTDRLVHKWRTEEMAIAVGTNTALADDPRLNSRLWPGKDPVRIVVDRHLRLPSFLNLFDGSVPTIVFNTQKHTLQGLDWPPSTSALQFYQVTEDVSLVPQIMNALYQLKLQSILVEGGAGLLQSFIDEDYWDEARVITNRELFAGEGLPAPALKSAMLLQTEHLFADTIQFFKNVYTSSA
jgi:diaminohydroxyphosphoribosylaminopyrimidine deaminase/5-amino-6-(5-phosphoribosylamino)uracil reductase